MTTHIIHVKSDDSNTRLCDGERYVKPVTNDDDEVFFCMACYWKVIND